MQKYPLAALYFSKALKIMQKTDQQGVQASNLVDSVTAHASVKVGDVCYNYGIALLKCNKHNEAFKCFMQASSLLRSNPRLWY